MVGGHHFILRNADFPPNNGEVLNISQIIKVVMSSADKYKLGELFINPKYAVPVRKNLEDIGNTQPPTPTHMENSTTYRVVNKNIQPKPTKSMDMNFH